MGRIVFAATTKKAMQMINVTRLVALPILLALLAAPALAADQIKMKGIGWYVIRSHDRDALADFYRALGFEEWASSSKIVGLRAGGGAALEIGHLDPDAPKTPPRTSRNQSQAMAIFGVNDVEEVVRRARAAGATFVERYDSPGGTPLYYLGDPDGNVVGFAQDGPMWGNTEELKALGLEPAPEK